MLIITVITLTIIVNCNRKLIIVTAITWTTINGSSYCIINNNDGNNKHTYNALLVNNDIDSTTVQQ